MPRIRCHYEDCIFLDAGFCSAEKIELDPESGCLTYQQAEEAEPVIADWEEEEAEAEVVDDEEEELEWEEEEDEDDDEEDDEDER